MEQLKVELIREIIAMYHTTRLAGVDFAGHVLSKPTVQKAFARFEASLSDGWSDAAKKWAEANSQPYLTSEGYSNFDRYDAKQEAEQEMMRLHALTPPTATSGAHEGEG